MLQVIQDKAGRQTGKYWPLETIEEEENASIKKKNHFHYWMMMKIRNYEVNWVFLFVLSIFLIVPIQSGPHCVPLMCLKASVFLLSSAWHSLTLIFAIKKNLYLSQSYLVRRSEACSLHVTHPWGAAALKDKLQLEAGDQSETTFNPKTFRWKLWNATFIWRDYCLKINNFCTFNFKCFVHGL